MSRFRLLTATTLSLTVFLGAIVPAVFGHGGGHGGGGHGGYGHGGFGYGGHHGYGYGGYHGYGYHGFGYGYRGFGYGYGYPGFGLGGFGLGGFGLGGFGLGGYGMYGLGGLGYGGLGYGGLGYGGMGYGGLGMGGMMMSGMGMMGGMMGMRGGMMMGGMGMGGYGGYSSGCNCCCLSAYPATGPLVPVPANGGANPPADGGSNTLPVPNKVTSRSPYTDYYARNANPAAPAATASRIEPTRYVDYYARKSEGADENKARLHVILPAEAELWLNGQRMHHSGAERDFITPKLNKGETYTYQVRARWTQDGQTKEEAIEVKVRANKTTAVQLGASALAKR